MFNGLYEENYNWTITELKIIFIPDLLHSSSQHVVCKQFHMINSAKIILDTFSEIRDLVCFKQNSVCSLQTGIGMESQ